MENDPISIYEVSAMTGRQTVQCRELRLYGDRLADGSDIVWHFKDYAAVRWLPAVPEMPFARLLFITPEEAANGVKIILSPLRPDDAQIMFFSEYGAFSSVNHYVQELYADIKAAFDAYKGSELL